MAMQWKCPDPDCPPTDFEPLAIEVFNEPHRQMCSCNSPGNCGNKEYPAGSIKPVST